MVSSLTRLLEESTIDQADDPEERFIMNSVSWEIYEALLTQLEDNSHYRIGYLDKVLEIVSPSFRHENTKENLGMLLERFLFSRRIHFFNMGSTTCKNQLRQVGVEPDKSYSIGELKSIPDLAIEVIIISGSIRKLEIYRRLGVREVWFWENYQFQLYSLRDRSGTTTAVVYPETFGYEEITNSELLPQLDISLLERCLLIPDSIQAIEEFERGM